VFILHAYAGWDKLQDQRISPFSSSKRKKDILPMDIK
jgi:hypothetical protein